MVIWLEDLTDEPTEEDVDPTEEAFDRDAARLTERVLDQPDPERIQAEDEGLSLVDLEAARFTRH